MISPKPIPNTDNELSDEGAAEIKRKFKTSAGGNQEGEPVVLDFPAEIDEFGFKPSDMDMGAVRRGSETRQLAGLGVPPIVTQHDSGIQRSTFSNTGEAREMVTETNLVPSWVGFAETLSARLLALYPDGADLVLRYDMSQVRTLQEDANAKATRFREGMVAGGVTRGEYRAVLGLPVTDADNVYLMPASVFLVDADSGEFVSETPTGEPPPDQDEPPDEDQPPDDEPPDDEPDPDSGEAFLRQTPRREARLVRMFERDLLVMERPFAADLDRMFAELGDRAAEAYREIAEPVTPQRQGDPPTPDLLPLVNRILARMRLVSFIDDDLAPLFRRHFLFMLDTTAEGIGSALGLTIRLPDTAAEKVIAAGGTRLGLVDIPTQTRDSIFRSLVQGAEEQEGVDARPPDQGRGSCWPVPTRGITIPITVDCQDRNQVGAKPWDG